MGFLKILVEQYEISDNQYAIYMHAVSVGAQV